MNRLNKTSIGVLATGAMLSAASIATVANSHVSIDNLRSKIGEVKSEIGIAPRPEQCSQIKSYESGISTHVDLTYAGIAGGFMGLGIILMSPLVRRREEQDLYTNSQGEQ